MKNTNLYLVAFLMFAFFSIDLQAQTWTASSSELYLNPTSSRVGIGVTNPSNSYKLHVSGGSTTNGIYAYTNRNSTFSYGAYGYSQYGRGLYGATSTGFGIYGYASNSSGHAGYFSGKVQLRGNLRGKSSNKDFIVKCGTEANETGPYMHMYGTDHSSSSAGNIVLVYGGATNKGNVRLTHYNGSSWSTNVQVNAAGKMSIGTTNTPSSVGGANISAYRLFVRGGILADEVRVRTGWADYVFAEDYQLTPLSKVEAHIAEKGYLHNTPSATQVENEGIEIGEITVNQQEKIEEIFLHLIELNKKVEALETENAALKTELATLKK